MNAKEIIKETIVDTGRVAYTFGFDVVNAVQGHGEKALNAALDRAAWIDADNRKAINDWVAAVKNGQDRVKTLLDENFKNFERLIEAL